MDSMAVCSQEKIKGTITVSVPGGDFVLIDTISAAATCGLLTTNANEIAALIE
jgi:hypothetical protein